MNQMKRNGSVRENIAILGYWAQLGQTGPWGSTPTGPNQSRKSLVTPLSTKSPSRSFGPIQFTRPGCLVTPMPAYI